MGIEVVALRSLFVGQGWYLVGLGVDRFPVVHADAVVCLGSVAELLANERMFRVHIEVMMLHHCGLTTSPRSIYKNLT